MEDAVVMIDRDESVDDEMLLFKLEAEGILKSKLSITVEMGCPRISV